ncbi:MAG: Rrf2 family transcriptional regulator [Candidatus Margulisbacteria bacterium]|nr:Rrf2 family transcriptional regulator [Candidatus Margulisiibacteriota bacterium]
MKISFKGDYALKALLYLAISYGVKDVIRLQELSGELDIPHKFLETVMSDLLKGGFVKSKRGKNGGYYLDQHPAQIILGDVVRYVDGPIEPIACVDSCYKDCKDVDHCALRIIWQKATKAVSDIVDNVTLQDLVEKSRKRKAILDYSI